MKYCTKCGNELFDEAVLCPKCGNAVGQVNRVHLTKQRNPRVGVVLGWFSVCTSVYLPVAGWILGGMGLLRSNEGMSVKGKRLSIIGIVMSSVVCIITVFLFMAGLIGSI